jgi:hypothetical protein
MPKGLKFQKWNAANPPLFPKEHMIRGDKETPLNEDYYASLKSQAWWELRLRFYRTYQMIHEGIQHPIESLISLDSSIPMLHQVTKELSQATSSLSPGKMKLQVNKAPEGTRSPNLADAIVMAYWPVITTRYTLDNIG